MSQLREQAGKYVRRAWSFVEKPLYFDPFGQTGLPKGVKVEWLFQ